MALPSYFDIYENLAFARDADGVLVLRFHTNNGPIVFTGQTHEDLPAALEELSLDPDNKALVVTGTGDSFMDQIDGPSLGEIFKPAAWEKTRTEGTKILQRLLDLLPAYNKRRPSRAEEMGGRHDRMRKRLAMRSPLASVPLRGIRRKRTER